MSKLENTVVFLDDLQLEEGEASEFQGPFLDAEMLVNGEPKTVLKEDEPFKAEVSVRAAQGSLPGKLKLSAEDFYGAKLFAESMDFKTDEKGRALIKINIEKYLKGCGFYMIRADFDYNGQKKSEFFRLARMPFLENKHANKNIFAICGGRDVYGYPEMLKRFDYLRAFGIGAIVKAWPEKELFDVYQKYGFSVMSTELARPFGKPAGEGFYKQSSELAILLDGKRLAGVPLDAKEISSDIEKEIEAAAFEAAKRYPHLKYWSFMSELHGWLPNLPPDELMKFLSAVLRGVKKASPDATVMQEGGPANMSSDLGIRVVGEELKAANKIGARFDAAGIHPYRQLPENPDLDADTKTFLDTLAANGYEKTPVLWEEGNYFPPYNLPEFKLNAHNGAASADHWCGMSPLSYDAGWGEKIAAAYTARYNLVALKYADRVKVSVMWISPYLFLDDYFAPFAALKTCNTLGSLLGNAKYVCDASFAPQTRAYIFEDEKRRPVAALWSHSRAVDNGEKPASDAFLKFSGFDPEFFGLMGDKFTARKAKDGASVIPVSPFPLFIRGPAGSLEQMRAALSEAVMTGSAGALKLAARPASLSTVSIEAVNTVSREWSGEISLNGKRESLSLSGKMSKILEIPLQNKISFSQIGDFKIIADIYQKNKASTSEDLSFPAFAVKKAAKPLQIDGNLDDWKDIPEIRLTSRVIAAKDKKADIGYKGDQEAWFRTAWDADFFYLAVRVIDDQFTVSDALPLPRRYAMDSIQVYIDCAGDNRLNKDDSFNATNYNFDFYPSEEGKNLTAFRRHRPSHQYCGGLAAPPVNSAEPNIKTAFKLTENGYIYEIAFPKWYIQPMLLEAGKSAGFGLMVNDADKDKVWKSSLSVIPGKGCFGNLSSLPAMLLTE